MKKLRKVCVVVTARPSYSRVKSVLTQIDNHPHLELQLIVSGTALLDKFGSTVDIIEKDGFNISERINSVLGGGDLITMAKATTNGIVPMGAVACKEEIYDAIMDGSPKGTIELFHGYT